MCPNQPFHHRMVHIKTSEDQIKSMSVALPVPTVSEAQKSNQALEKKIKKQSHTKAKIAYFSNLLNFRLF